MEDVNPDNGWSYVQSLDAELKDYQLMIDGIRTRVALQDDKFLNELVHLLDLRISSTREIIIEKLKANGRFKIYAGDPELYEPPIGMYL